MKNFTVIGCDQEISILVKNKTVKVNFFSHVHFAAVFANFGSKNHKVRTLARFPVSRKVLPSALENIHFCSTRSVTTGIS